MARDLNKVMLIGRLAADPELRTTTSGQTVANFRIATGRQWNDAQGQPQTQTEFTRVVVWSRLADLVNQYLRKGRQVYVEGRIQTRSYVDKANVKQWRTEVVAENVIFLGSAGEESARAVEEQREGAIPPPPDRIPGQPASPKVPAAVETPAREVVEEIRIEDIPF